MFKKYFSCPHCNKQLINQSVWDSSIENENEFWCDNCDKIYILWEKDGDSLGIMEEDAI